MNQILENLANAGFDLQEITEELKDGHLFMSVRVANPLPVKSINLCIRNTSSGIDMLQLEQAITINPDEGFSDHPIFTPVSPGRELVEDI